MKKKVKKNIIYLTLDDLQKLYGLDGKLLKKLKKRKKRRKTSKNIKFEKIKDSSQMPGVQYFTNNSNMDTQFLKDQIKSLQDKQNKLLITDMQPNLVNNRLLMDLKEDNKNIKSDMLKIYGDASNTFNFIYDQFEDLKSNNNAGYTVNYNDNIGDFSNNPNWTNPKESDENKQINNTLSQKSESYETTDYFPDVDLNELFYGDNTSDVMEPPTEDKPVNDDEQPEDIPEDITEEPQFIELPEEIISDPVVDKPPFIPPKRKHKENLHLYRARTEYFRKLYYGKTVSDYSIQRYGKDPNK